MYVPIPLSLEKKNLQQTVEEMASLTNSHSEACISHQVISARRNVVQDRYGDFRIGL